MDPTVVNMGNSSDEEDYDRFARIKPSDKSKQSAYVGQVKRDTSTDAQYMLSGEAHSTDEVLGTGNITQRKANIQAKKDAQREQERRGQEQAKAAAQNERVFGRTHLQEGEALPELMAELEREGQRAFTVQQSHINKVSVTFLDRGGREVTARKDACRERCWMVVGDTGVSLFDGEELCLMETHLYSEMQWSYQVRHNVEEVQLAIKGLLKSKTIHLPSEDARLIVEEMSDRQPLTTGRNDSTMVDGADDAVVDTGADLGGSGGLVGALAAKAAAKHDKVFAQTRLQEGEQLPELMAELEREGQKVFTVQQSHINKVSVTFLDHGGHEVIARKDACHERCWMVIGDTSVSLYDGLALTIMETHLFSEIQRWAFAMRHGLEEVVLEVKNGKKKTRTIHLPSEDAQRIVEEMDIRHPHEPFDADEKAEEAQDTQYNLAELEQQGHTVYCVQQTHVNKISVTVVDEYGRPKVARKDACKARCWFVVGDEGILLFDGVEICQIGKHKYTEMKSWSDGAMGDNVTLMFDQGGRKKTKIVHLPAENATEIAEEMTARFRKLQSKTNKQAAIERKKKAKAKKAQQLEADKKGQAHDDMAARFKADLQVHEAVGDRRTGRMGPGGVGAAGHASGSGSGTGQQKSMGGVKLLSAQELKKQHQREQVAKKQSTGQQESMGGVKLLSAKELKQQRQRDQVSKKNSTDRLGQPPRGTGTTLGQASKAGGAADNLSKAEALSIINRNVKEADVAGVGWWLYSVSPELGSYVAAFKQSRIDGPKLLKLSDLDMQAMGMRQQHREAIIEARTDLLVSNALAKAR